MKLIIINKKIISLKLKGNLIKKSKKIN